MSQVGSVCESTWWEKVLIDKSLSKRTASIRKVGFSSLIFVVIVTGLIGGCVRSDSSPSPVSSVLSLQLNGGAAWLGGFKRGGQLSGGTALSLGQSLDLSWNQIIWTGMDESATLLVGESDQLVLNADGGFQLASPVPPNQRPVLSLFEGRLRYRAAGDRYALGVHLEVPFELRILLTDLVAAPVVAETELEMWIEEDIAYVTVLNGEVAARGNGVSATLYADWRAIVRPGEPMEVIPPSSDAAATSTATPTATPTSIAMPTPTPTTTPTTVATSVLTATPRPTATLVLTVTSTPLGTLTSTSVPATATVTPTPTATATLTPTPSPTFQPRPSATPLPPPTDTPLPPPTQPPPPPPTQPPPPTATQPPPPTATPLPPPTDTPLPPPTDTPLPPTNTVRPTPKPGDG